MFAREFNQQVQFRRAVLEGIARAFVTLEHILAERTMIIFAQRAAGERDALDLADDVMRALILAFGQSRFVRLQKFGF